MRRSEHARWRPLVANLGRQATFYVPLALGITAVMVGFTGSRSAVELVAVFAVNLLISVCIGASLWVVHRALPMAPWSSPGRRSTALVFVLGAVTLTAGVMGGAFVGLAILRLLDLQIARLFPYQAVVRVGVPVALAIVGVSEALRRLRRRTEEAEAARMRSELSALHARLNPHFLFNSLNTVAALIGEDPARAEVAVLELSALMRHTVVGAKARWVRLGEELEATRSYLAFEALRYGDRLAFELDVEAGLEETPVPPLVLQPLVENAVNHGVGRREGGRVGVVIRRAEGGIDIEVEDDGPGASSHSGTGTAQADLQERLRLTYEGRARFVADRGPWGGYRVRLHLPQDGLR